MNTQRAGKEKLQPRHEYCVYCCLWALRSPRGAVHSVPWLFIWGLKPPWNYSPSLHRRGVFTAGDVCGAIRTVCGYKQTPFGSDFAVLFPPGCSCQWRGAFPGFVFVTQVVGSCSRVSPQQSSSDLCPAPAWPWGHSWGHFQEMGNEADVVAAHAMPLPCPVLCLLHFQTAEQVNKSTRFWNNCTVQYR